MEQAAVQQIANLAIAAQDRMPLTVDADASIAIVPDGFHMVRTESFNAKRDRFRGEYSTSAISSFVEYVAHRQAQATELQTFINAEQSLTAKTYFNLGNTTEPGHADDIASLTLKKKPEFAALERASGNKFRQQHLIDWLDDWADYIDAYGENGIIEFDKAIRALRKVKITKGSELDSQVRDYGYQASASEKLEATGTDENLPQFFMLNTESFHGLKPRALKISIRIAANDEAPAFLLRFVGEEAHTLERAEEFKELLTSNLKGIGQIYQGAFTA